MAANKSLTLSEISAELLKLKSCVVTAHVSPDPDAVGSSVALALALRSKGIKAEIVIPDLYPETIDPFVAGIEIHKEVPAGDFDALVVTDTATKKRVMLEDDVVKSFSKQVNIDHHISNPAWGDVNYIDPDSAASCQILFELFEEMKVDIDQQLANLLLIGIIDDTGSFRFNNTSSSVLKCAATLVERGGNPSEIANSLYFNIPQRQIKLRSMALGNLSMELGGKLAVISVSDQMMKDSGTVRHDTEGIVDIARAIDGTVAAAFLCELDDKWKLSLRSKSDKLSVDGIAGNYGGGGHKAAAGCVIAGSEQEVREKITKAFAKAIEAAGL